MPLDALFEPKSHGRVSARIIEQAQRYASGPIQSRVISVREKASLGERLLKDISWRSDVRVDTLLVHDVPTSAGMVYIVIPYDGKKPLATQFLTHIPESVPCAVVYSKGAEMWGMGFGQWEPEDDDFEDFAEALQEEEELSKVESWEHSVGETTFKINWSMHVFPSLAGGSVFQCRLPPEPGLFKTGYRINEFFDRLRAIRQLLQRVGTAEPTAEPGPMLADEALEALPPELWQPGAAPAVSSASPDVSSTEPAVSAPAAPPVAKQTAKVRCPNPECAVRLTVKCKLAGQTRPCPKCGTPVTVAPELFQAVDTSRTGQAAPPTVQPQQALPAHAPSIPPSIDAIPSPGLQYEPAPSLPRFVSWSCENVAFLIVLMILSALSAISESLGNLVGFPLVLATIAAFLCKDANGGIIKSFFGLRVIEVDSGDLCSWKKSVLRNIVVLCTCGPHLNFFLIFTKDKRHLGDMIAGTRVVRAES